MRTISVAGKKIGMQGLEKIFAELKAASRQPSPELATVLVELAGKENYIDPSARKEYEKALLVEYRRYLGEVLAEEEGQALSIKILGPGCQRCESLSSNVRSALAELGLTADVEHVRDVASIAEYGVLGTPALIINGKPRSVGKVLTKEQVKRLLSEPPQG